MPLKMPSLRSPTAPGEQRRGSGLRRKLSLSYSFRKDSADKLLWDMVPLLPEWDLKSPPNEGMFCSPLSATFVASPESLTPTDRFPTLTPTDHSPTRVCSDMKLPYELWTLVFDRLADGYDIHALALACRGLHAVAQPAIARHAALAAAHGTATAETHDALCALYDRALASPPARYAVTTLRFRCAVRWDLSVAARLPRLLALLPNIRTLALDIESAEVADACARAGFADVRLPRLRAFETNMGCAAAVAAFVEAHPRLCDLALLPGAVVPDCDDDGDAAAPTLSAPTFSSSSSSSSRATASDAHRPLHTPGLRTLSGGLETALACAGSARALTHLHVRAHAPHALARVAAALGPRLVSLRLGALERIVMPDSPLAAAAAPWAVPDVLARFPRLRYLQMHMAEPDFVPLPIQWQATTHPTRAGHRGSKSAPPALAPTVELEPAAERALTVGWVLEEEAWGTVLDASDPDQVRVLFEEVARDVLRRWAPRVGRVVYGDAGVPDTAVVLDAAGERVVRVREERLGEDFWKRV